MNIIFNPFDFTQEEFYEKVGDKKDYLKDLFCEYAKTRDIKIKDEIENIVFPIMDEIVEERTKIFFDSFVEQNKDIVN